MKKLKFLITGGRGYIMSHLIELILSKGHSIVDVDKLTYASNKPGTLSFDNNPDYELIIEDIKDLKHLPLCDIIIHGCAESHVDNALIANDIFIQSNIVGTVNLLNLVRGKTYNRPKFIFVSTDEVYSDIYTKENPARETDMIYPKNPYSASKAAAEMCVIGFCRSYNMDFEITRSSNNYGSNRQFPEKLIPKIIECIKNGAKVPVHSQGEFERNWLFVEDNCDAIFKVATNEKSTNDIWNIASNNSMNNIDVVKQVFEWHGITDYEKHIENIVNRHGQDNFYNIDSSKIRKQLNWVPKYDNELFNFIKND